MTRVTDLTKGDTVKDSANTTGRVVGFKVDGVVLEMGGKEFRYTDEDLKAHGVVRVSP
jgi:hypothetical protein